MVDLSNRSSNVSKICKAYVNNRDENCAMGNGCELVGTAEKLGDIGGSLTGAYSSTDGTDSDGHAKENLGMVRARYKKRWNKKQPMKIWGKHPRGRPNWKVTVRRHMKAWKEWTTDREGWKCLCKPAILHGEKAAKGEKKCKQFDCKTTLSTHQSVVGNDPSAGPRIDHSEAFAVVVVEDHHFAVGQIRPSSLQIELPFRAC